MVQRRSNLAPNPVSPNTKSAGNTNIKTETDYNTKRKDYKSDTNKISIKNLSSQLYYQSGKQRGTQYYRSSTIIENKNVPT